MSPSQNERVQPGGDNIPQDSPGNARARREAIVLWTGILAGPLLWFTHQQVSFALVPWVCAHGGVSWLHALTGLCVVGTLAAGGRAWPLWQRERTRVGEATAGQQRVRFMAAMGLLSSLFFVLVIIAQWVPMLLLDPCQR